MIGRSKYNTFRGLKEKIWRRICSWKSVLLSTAGKEILIKSVLQAIPAYAMSVFKMPCMLLKEIEAMLSRFWWDHNKPGKGIHWRSWEKLGQVKDKGGLGFRNLVSFNKALLAKQVWRLMQEPTSLVSQVFKHKYYNHSTILGSKIGSSPSHIWRSLWSVLGLVKAGSVWRVGNGEAIRIWHDRWLPRPISYMVQTPINLLDSEAKVVDLINVENRAWKTNMLDAVFNKEDAELIASLPISIRGDNDKLIWVNSCNGRFSVKSAYFLDSDMRRHPFGQPSNNGGGDGQWRKIWHLQVPGKVKLFIWRALNDIIPTKGILARKQIVNEGSCPVCTKEVETVLHVLWSCPAATDVWGEAISPVKKWHIAYEDFSVLWRGLSTRLEAEQLDQIAVVLYQLWKRRNRWVFDNKFQSPSIIYKHATDELEVFKQVGLLQKQQVADTGMQNQERVRVLWEPAGANCYKFNFDATFDKNNNTMGIGGVLRDSRGEAEIMLSAPRAHVPSVFHAECYALIRVMEFAMI
ncbi:hypothetical protein CIPAW_15G073500 [Carya illinoinensis]|uniref:Reverse transcriptase zinc-binding domain-containing protein n=1 Tax=Carya illinoinensis TaxID=32201 RepID=A0A8T1N9S1_CARIL|nr:hypothetical protein CIPAW_15G073500 [Carya illinoinensis]